MNSQPAPDRDKGEEATYDPLVVFLYELHVSGGVPWVVMLDALSKTSPQISDGVRRRVLNNNRDANIANNISRILTQHAFLTSTEGFKITIAEFDAMLVPR